MIPPKPTMLMFPWENLMALGKDVFSSWKGMPLKSLISLFVICFPQGKYIITVHKNFCVTFGILSLGTMDNAYRTYLHLSYEKEKWSYSCHIPGSRGISPSMECTLKMPPITASPHGSWMNDRSHRREISNPPFQQSDPRFR